ncbi:MAG: hypothetical protein ACTSRP_26525, partial [Candidatus Helarchaeota archaeon]
MQLYNKFIKNFEMLLIIFVIVLESLFINVIILNILIALFLIVFYTIIKDIINRYISKKVFSNYYRFMEKFENLSLKFFQPHPDIAQNLSNILYEMFLTENRMFIKISTN